MYLYKVKTMGGYESFVVADDPTQAYNTFLAWMKEHDYGYYSGRYLQTVDCIAEFDRMSGDGYSMLLMAQKPEEKENNTSNGVQETETEPATSQESHEVTDDIAEQVIQIIRNRLDIPMNEAIHRREYISGDLGADSLDSVEMVMEAERTFEILIEDNEWNSLSTVGDVIDMVKKKVEEKAPN